MKALLALKGITFPLTHDLIVLNAKCVSAEINMDIEKKWLELLSAYAVAARYDRERPSLEDAKEALEIATTVRKFSRAFLGLNK